jgi:predicted MFS family arabinose efflux permease
MVMVAKMLPNVTPNFSKSYASLLYSSVYQLKRFALLRSNALLITVLFGVFCSFWTTLTFKLSQSPFNFESDIIGLFGILAAAGALLAPYIGKVADKVNPTFTKILSVGMIVVSILIMKWFDTSLAAFIVAILLLDIGFQAVQINNLAQIYTLDESAHSRINTAYMSSMFVGGAFGTFIGVYCWEHGGWALVTIQLLSLSVLSLAIIIYAALSTQQIKVA